jgi:hypothetical protein
VKRRVSFEAKELKAYSSTTRTLINDKNNDLCWTIGSILLTFANFRLSAFGRFGFRQLSAFGV